MGFKDRPKKGSFKALDAFVRSHPGCEAYLEPRTATLPQSLLLTSTDGAWTREEVPDRQAAASFCRRKGIPLYDAAVVGYPKSIKAGANRDLPTDEELEKWFSSGAE